MYVDAREVFQALFRLMIKKGLLTKQEYSLLCGSMYGSAERFIETVDEICREGE